MIYKCLSHHYVLQRSVVFIVDTNFSSQIYTDLASSYVRKIFSHLDKEDYFGYISLEDGSRFDEVPLEKKGKNTHIKEAYLESCGRPDELLDFLRSRS